MKKHSLAEFFKSKSFYALLCVGALAIIAITMVGLNQSSDKNEGKNLVDLNEPIASDVADNSDNSQIDTKTDPNNTTSDTAANNEPGAGTAEVAQNPNGQNVYNEPVTDGSLLEFDIVDEQEAVAANEPEKTTQTAKNTPESTEETASVPEDSQEVMSPDSLYFDDEEDLTWPVMGNILMNYSDDKVVYHETLAQFKVNPAILIDAEVGTEVLSAATGVVKSITTTDETGLTVTVDIGSGYSLVYGQLMDDIKFEVGDMINEGQTIGTVAEPTMYYTVEGSNLFFQVLKDDTTLNPMLYLE
ncbi:hypothetical protein acsn021_00840 [Anaerocolumna cellulosilytica]|uniref:M23ase beta-sheet core domain-containing protein n=1 Tax=Anaerocolumna cellulosilytica TaxID=433286 RepID=A0A6S6QYK0_9FIRM|nr:peptidoglycan DD-metalloendopeptidase family protein [Anaerocolumna cellulosilytica]MBB5196165.1 murein DD-endopeptidase MepM/ murein hydrolase activator NlpD [Anaerocolumna cellulosilytica]BCJ92515.1 hypothetical protein acsn021_00840 [Anaerocolumna cellulosilytica]